MAVDWTNPTNSRNYANVLSDLTGRDLSLAKMDFGTDTNVPTDSLRFEPTKYFLQKWNGTSWTTYPLALANNSWLTWRNAADNAAINVIKVDSGNNTEINALTGEFIEFKINDVQQAQIDGSGNFYLNTTTQRNSGKLSIDFDGNSTGGQGVNDTGSVNGAAYIAFLSGGTFRGSITNNNNTAVAYNTTSDYRLKDAVKPITEAVEKVKALKPSTWIWKESGTEGQGFIAHELKEVVPEAVTGEKDAIDNEGNPVYQGVDTRFLVALLTAAIQELNQRLEALENK